MGANEIVKMGWEESADQIVNGVQSAQRELKEQQSSLGTNVQAGFAQLRQMLDDQERQLTSSLQGVIQSREQQLQEWERNVMSHRESLRAGTREIQSALQSGDMALVSARSKELEVSTNALKEMESAFPSLSTPLGGNLDFHSVEAALQGLAWGGAAAGGSRGSAPSSYTPAAAMPVGRTSPVAATPTSGFNTSSFASPKPMATPQSPYTPDSAASTGRGTAVPNAIYINSVPEETTEADLREVFEKFGDIKMINSRHIATGGFAFIFFSSEHAATAALENPRVTIHGKPVNILAKKQLVPKDRADSIR